jgi:hypothetical protein
MAKSKPAPEKEVAVKEDGDGGPELPRVEIRIDVVKYLFTACGELADDLEYEIKSRYSEEPKGAEARKMKRDLLVSNQVKQHLARMDAEGVLDGIK